MHFDTPKNIKKEDFTPHITSVQYCEVVQYIGGRSVHRGDKISTLGG